jgi:hypothetical protein
MRLITGKIPKKKEYQHENIKKEGNIKFCIQISLVQGFASKDSQARC